MLNSQKKTRRLLATGQTSEYFFGKQKTSLFQAWFRNIFWEQDSGGDLLSLMEVPSALTVLTALFGMGRGVTQSQEPPEFWSQKIAIGLFVFN